ncbi:C2H2 finger domain protein [Geosmithia morbida]|uniref:C2H2 finger domain protein n=1 Tax=Geosmithia morbida TaxID=1094350 RepID=A0A9P5CZ52_9HYPO|nr:C2H2 finger domain protein [Geosmithia morbida]KAF4121188.1 C2H2 finger domain protein [Geosmithia morbida]
MASSREMNQTTTTRPLAHRPTAPNSPPTGGLPGRQTHARNNSNPHGHSLLTTSLNPNHRITRRKSVTGPNANIAALAAAVRDAEALGADPASNPSARRNTLSKLSLGRIGLGNLPSPPSSLPNKGGIADIDKPGTTDSAIEDGADLSADDGSTDSDQNSRSRRASDGQPLTKDGKKSSGNSRVELKCKKCGKGYKHSSCLTKHLWEHTPEWSLTSKLLISKHQQVQLLEAASVLVAMNETHPAAPGQDGAAAATSPPDSTRDFISDPESASPTASGYSDQADRLSSADTTPPPTMDDGGHMYGLPFGSSRRHGNVGGGFSRSYQSVPSLAPGSLPGANPGGFGHAPRTSEHRPSSSGINNTGQDDRDLAAAVELLSCSFNSSNAPSGNLNGGGGVGSSGISIGGSNGTVMLADAPPVPPVPAQYLDRATSIGSGPFVSSFPGRQPESFTRGDVGRGSEDVKMGDHHDSGLDDDDFDMQSRARSDEEDDGVFGCMEE